jgi:parallel beta-helix repeat protein
VFRSITSSVAVWLTLTGAPAGAAVLCVNAAGSGGCVKTISAAVVAASANDIINVAAGTYKENVTIGKRISLIGAEPAKTIIDAAGQSTGIYVNGIDNANLTGVVISGFTVQNANFEGILVANAAFITVSGNTLTGNNNGLKFAGGPPSCPGIPSFETNEDFDCGEAIHLTGVHHSAILNNTITNNSGGILLSDDTGATHDNVIAGNIVTDNPSDCGITLASHDPAAFTNTKTAFGVYSNVVVGNQSSRNGLKGEGAGVGLFASSPGTQTYGNLVVNNVLTGNDLPGVSVHGHTPNQNLAGNVIVGNMISGNGPDADEAATPGTAGIAFTGVSPIDGTLILGNTIDRQNIGFAWNVPGEARVHRNSFNTNFGVYNLGSGTVNADNNWWGCSGGPSGLSVLTGCGITSGAVTVTTSSTAPSK